MNNPELCDSVGMDILSWFLQEYKVIKFLYGNCKMCSESSKI